MVRTDVEKGLILVEGAVPGVKGGWIRVRDAVKRSLPKEAPRPGAFREVKSANGQAPEAKAPATEGEGA